jgi:hypothetical protein
VQQESTSGNSLVVNQPVLIGNSFAYFAKIIKVESTMFKLLKHLTKAGMIVISILLPSVFLLFMWIFMSAESFNWNDFGLFMLLFASLSLIFWAVFKIFRMIIGLKDK